ncbi:MAG: PilN domain-containing protein [Candidatus Omnitrophica bacterium]|nr:PilN domain-containing protein [Candidatus Omnitrophota bacterium]
MNEIIVIPRHLAIVRFIDIPSVIDDEIEKMVEFQAIKEIPYSKEDMIFSYRNFGSYKDGFSSIMLVIAKREMIDEMLREKDFNVDAIRLHSELLHLFLLKKGIINTEGVNLVIHVGKDDSEIMMLDKNQPKFSRGFKNSDRFLEEITHSLLAYKKDKNNPEIDTIIVAHSSIIDINNIKPYIIEHFRIPVNFYEYSEDLTTLELPAKIDLVPKEFSDKKMKSQKRKQKFITYSLIGFVIILFFASVSFKIHEKKRLLKMLTSRIDQLQSKTERLDIFLKKTMLAKKHRLDGRFIIEILKYSYNLIPVNVSLSGLSYDGGELISYKGSTKDMSNIFPFVKKLEKSEYFDSVEVKYATKKKVKGEELTDFIIQCRIGKNL